MNARCPERKEIQVGQESEVGSQENCHREIAREKFGFKQYIDGLEAMFLRLIAEQKGELLQDVTSS